MIGITLSVEQIRAAPPEVRRWIEQPAPAAEDPPLPASPVRRIAERTAPARPRRWR